MVSGCDFCVDFCVVVTNDVFSISMVAPAALHFGLFARVFLDHAWCLSRLQAGHWQAVLGDSETVTVEYEEDKWLDGACFGEPTPLDLLATDAFLRATGDL